MTKLQSNLLLGHAASLVFGLVLGLALGNLAAGLPLGFLLGLSLVGDGGEAEGRP